MIAVFLRELRSYYFSPIGYIFMGFFLLLAGFFFATDNVLRSNPQFQGVLSSIIFVFLVIVPILTMRLFADEKRQRTDQLLLTVPVSVTGIVLGKYLAAVAVFLFTLLVTVLYPITMSFFGRLPGWEILGGYVGFFLLGCTFIAVGMLMSSLTDNQVISAVATFAALLLMWIIDFVQNGVPAGTVPGIVFASCLGALVVLWVYLATRNLAISIATLLILAALVVVAAVSVEGFYETFIIDFLAWFSLTSRFQRFMGGVLALSPIVYYVSFSTVLVFLTVRVIERNRWT
ncbi:MAG: ABC-2 transporter permease [Spirochaetaceae bacterium]|nr:ABC-2 transporter permease [Spirochaetaceae bacterium]